jgi:hypothetical protein
VKLHHTHPTLQGEGFGCTPPSILVELLAGGVALAQGLVLQGDKDCVECCDVSVMPLAMAITCYPMTVKSIR